MRIAILGASPISIINALDLSHSHQVSLFGGGGVWWRVGACGML